MRNNKLTKLLIILFTAVIIVTGCSKNNIEPADEQILEEIKSEDSLGTGPNDHQKGTTLEKTETQEVAEELVENIEKSTDALSEEPTDEQASGAVEEQPIEPTEDVAEEISEEPAAIEEEIEEVKENAIKIEGKVGNKAAFTLDELKAMTDLIFEGNYYSLNSFGTTKHNIFKGVNLWNLLEQKAQILPEAATVSIIATDGYKMEFTVDEVKKQDYIDETNPEAKFPMIIAWEQDGEEYSTDEGPPFKLIVGQKEPGDVNKPQWVSNIDKIIVD